MNHVPVHLRIDPDGSLWSGDKQVTQEEFDELYDSIQDGRPEEQK